MQFDKSGSDCKTFVEHYRGLVAEMQDLPDASDMSREMLHGVVRTVSRHHTGSEAGAPRDWSDAEEIAIVGRVCHLLADCDHLSIRTHSGRIHVPFLVAMGDPTVFLERTLLFHWAKIGKKEYAVLYTPDVCAGKVAKQSAMLSAEGAGSGPGRLGASGSSRPTLVETHSLHLPLEDVRCHHRTVGG